jgi:hypothetical protein
VFPLGVSLYVSDWLIVSFSYNGTAFGRSDSELV